MAGVNAPYRMGYETCAASATTVLGGTGATGDYLEMLVVTVNTAATAQVQIKDGSGSAYTIFPNSPGSGVGIYTIPIDAASTSGAWSVITSAGSTVLAVGIFSA